MKKISNVTFWGLAFFLCVTSTGLTQNMPDPLSPPRMVNDFTGFLDTNEVNALEGKLRKFNNQTSTQIYLIIVNDLLGYSPADYASRIGEKWGVGQKGKDNGIVVLVKPKTNDSRGEVFISPGYGLEGAVPDIAANRIVDYEIIPAFKQGAYYEGLNKGTDILISLTKGEFTADEYAQSTESSGGGIGIIGFIILIVIFSSIFGGRSRMGRHQGIGGSLPFWLMMGMMNSGSRSHGGSFGNFSGGTGGFGGFGGFGGGGGGSFGGGGAGGSW